MACEINTDGYTLLFKGYNDGLSGQFFRIFENICWGFVVATCDLVYDKEAIFHLV